MWLQIGLDLTRCGTLAASSVLSARSCSLTSSISRATSRLCTVVVTMESCMSSDVPDVMRCAPTKIEGELCARFLPGE